ncbi:MAG TPA: transposase [Bacteroidales bacterium]|nr:transposase [Bacteroidales bacterium]
MVHYNPAIHHRKSYRLKNYDYSGPGLYAITICCEQHQHFFGTIVDGQLLLNDGGKIAEKCWREIPNHYPNTRTHEYVIMPNHIHGIIEIIKKYIPQNNYCDVVGCQNFDALQLQSNVSQNIRTKNEYQKIIHGSIRCIVRGYKIGVTKWFRQNYPNEFPKNRKIWQQNYYDRILWSIPSYERMANYINNNPTYWVKDFYNK